MLVAHATEPPVSVGERRADVPAALAALVMQCLEKDPARRPLTSEAVVARLEQLVTPLGTTAPTAVTPAAGGAPRRRGAWAAVVAAVVALGAVGILATRGRVDPSARVPASAQTILVAPFQTPVDDSALVRMGREVALLLGTNLDQVGPIRAIDGMTVAARFRGAFTKDEAMAAARDLGARSVVFGTIARVGGAVRVDAQLLGVDSALTLARFGAASAPDSLAALTDAAAFDLVRQLWSGRDAPTPNLAAVTTRSVPALRAFLEGERRFADGDILGAGDAYQRAVEADPEFWYAYGRFNSTRSWMQLPRNRRYDSLYLAHLDVLPERERLFEEAQRMNATDSAPRQLEVLRRLVERHPDYWRGIFQYADWLAHGGGRYWGVSAEEALEAFERVLLLNPRLAPAWEHLRMMAASVDTGRALRGLAQLEPLLPAGDTTVRGFRALLDTATDGGVRVLALGADPQAMVRELKGGRQGGFDQRFIVFALANAGYPRSQRALNALLREHLPGKQDQTLLVRGDAASWAVSGQWDSARVLARQYVHLAGDSATLEPYRYAVLAHALGLLDGESVAEERRAVREAALAGSSRDLVELAWLDGFVASNLGDADGIRRALAAAEASGDIARSFVTRTLPLLAQAGSRPVLADSLAAFEMARVWLPAGLDGWRIPISYPIQRLLVARAVAARGDTTMALKLLAFVDDVPPIPTALRAEAPVRGFAELERARLHEGLGDRARAAHGYRMALRRWSGGTLSAGMEPFLREAETGHARVSGVTETQRR
jgi:tetratricopeptide (TPR) repeat protein